MHASWDELESGSGRLKLSKLYRPSPTGGVPVVLRSNFFWVILGECLRYLLIG